MNISLVLAAFTVSGVSAQSLTSETPVVTEKDAGPVEVRFSYQFPAAAAARSWEFAVIPRALQAGTDFTPFRETRTAAAGVALDGKVSVPVLPNLLPADNGALSLVLRGPEASDWAFSMSAPEVLTEFNAASGNGRVLYWSDDMVVMVRMNAAQTSTSLLTFERSAAGELIQRSVIPVSDLSGLSAKITGQLMVVPGPGTFHTWRAGPTPFTWTAVSGSPADLSGVPYLISDRLLMGDASQNAVYRFDPAASGGWRRTGGIGGGAGGEVFATGEDFVILRRGNSLSLWERVATSEDVWQMTYTDLPEVVSQVVGTAPGTLAVFSPEGLEIHERTAGKWGKAGTIPVSSVRTEGMSVAMAGDWIAVGQGYLGSDPGGLTGTVRLFLRNPQNRSLWDPVGTLNGPGYAYGRKLFWNGPELISSPGDHYVADGLVVLRKFQGASAKVLDDDRNKLELLTTSVDEPLTGIVVRQVVAELPLPAAADMTVDYQLVEGTALSGQDFQAASGQIVIPAGNSRAYIPVTVMARNSGESAKSFTARLTPAGPAPVTGTVSILTAGPPAVVTAEATPLVEGYGSSTVTLRETPATGGSLPAGSVDIRISTGGFDNPAETSVLATRGVDLPDQVISRVLSPATPEAFFNVTATQDALMEMSETILYPEMDERVRAEFSGLGPAREAGTFGLAFDGPVPPLPPALGAEATLLKWTVGGGWLFAEWGTNNFGAQTSEGVVACHKLEPDGKPIPAAVQYFPWKGRYYGAPLSGDGGTLVMSLLSAGEGEGPTNILRIYEPVGPAEAPWRMVSEWRLFLQAENSPARLLNPHQILWGNQLLEKTGGSLEWRLAAVSRNEQILDADGDRMLTLDNSPDGGVKVWRRKSPLEPEWILMKNFSKSQDQLSPLGTLNRVRGRTLVLVDILGRVEIHRENPDGIWEFEQRLPKGANFPAIILAGESTLVLADGTFSRIGPPNLPWVRTGSLPVDTGDYVENVSSGDHSLSSMNEDTLRLRILRGGVPLSIYDDDSLKFTLRNASGKESWFGETVAVAGLESTRAAPFPMTVRVRSQDNGGAVAGVDYVPVDQVLSVAGPGENRPYTRNFPVRILSDRIPEDSETFNLVLDPPLIGTADGPAEVAILDNYTSALKPALALNTLYEPAEGSSTQAVEFVFDTAFDQDLQFLATLVTGGGTAAAGTDFTLPAGPLTLKAGETRLRVPISVLADAVDEGTEEFTLRVSKDPAIFYFFATARVRIIDSSVTGMTADAYATGVQGAVLRADGQSGRPAGLAANDSSPPAGDYRVGLAPDWGSVAMQADGTFTATPEPNVIGPVWFAARVETLPYQQFLSSESVWRYLHPVNGVNPATANPAFTTTWDTAAFDDSSWASGAGTLTYGGFPLPPAAGTGTVTLATPPDGKRYTDYFRATFQSAAAGTVPLTLRLYCDDGAVIYINGAEYGRALTTSSTTFQTAADTYTMVTGGNQTEVMEIELKTVDLGLVPLNAGANVLAVSLHNLSASSSDLGIRLMSLETGIVSDPVPVLINFADAHLPPDGVADSFICPQNAEFRSGDHYGAGLLDNDGLISPSGGAYDPIFEITASAVSAGNLVLVGNTGNFIYTPPADFSGAATFSYQIRDKDGLSAPVPVTLNVKPLQPFDVWKAEALSPGVSGDADSDGDGLSNFMEYTLGTDPADPVTDAGHGFVFGPGAKIRVMIRRAADLAWRLESAPSPDATAWKMVMEGRGLNYQSLTPAGIVISDVTAGSQILNITADAVSTPRLFHRLRTFRIPPQGP